MIVCAALLVVYSRYARDSGDPAAAFAGACATCGPRDVRLASGFRPGGASARTAIPNPALVIAGRLEEMMASGSSPRVEGVVGIARVLSGQADAGIATLAAAVARAPQDAVLLNDFAAVILQRALKADRPDEIVRALSLARRAQRLDPRMPEPLFNAAVAQEALGLTDAALATWKQYLDLDTESEWVPIARSRRDSATTAANRIPAPGPAVTEFEEELLRAWPAAVGRAGAAGDVRERAVAAAADLKAATGDVLPSEAAQALPVRRSIAASEIAEGLSAFREARALYDADQPTAAAGGFEKAERLLTRHGHPYAGWATFYRGISRYLGGALDEGANMLDSVLEVSERRRYLALSGRAHYMKGLIAQTRADPTSALNSYEAALKQATAVGDAESQAAALSQMAGVRDMLGDSIGAWRARLSALALLPRVGHPRRRHVVLHSSARAAVADGAPEAALDFADAALANARAWKRAGALAEVHTQLARIALALRQPTDAERAVSAARQALAEVTDAPFARRFELELLAASAEARVAADDDRSVEDATASIARLREANGSLLIPAVLRLRAKAWVRRGRPDEAQRDLQEALAAYESQRASIPMALGRVTAFPEHRAIVSDLVGLHVSANRPSEAFDAAERGRARSLLGSAPAEAPVGINRVRDALGPGTAMVYYAVTDSRVFAWTITRTAFHFTTLPVSPSALATEVEAFRRSLEAYDDPRAAHDGERLFSHVIAPLAEGLNGAQNVIVVPDDMLSGIPFAALRAPASKRYLAETYRLRLSPSATIAVAPSVAAPQGRPLSALVVAPAQVESSAGGLRDSAAEARAIATEYAGATLLTGASATKVRILDEAREYDVIHFAGHAETSVDYPNLSRLVVNDPANRPDSLYAYELNGLRLPRTRLVVLAGCRTGLGRALRGEGVLSLARPFVAAGVPAVIATLWDIRDRPARTFFARFHALHMDDPVAALQRVQIELMKSEDPELRSPGTWGGIFVITTGLP